jgi:hypothetical protein
VADAGARAAGVTPEVDPAEVGGGHGTGK